MSISLILFILSLFISSSLTADKEGVKLTGSPKSSEGSTGSNAFSDNLNEEFKSSKDSYGWVGLEFQSAYRITKIGWAQKDSDISNFLLGVFEGSNDANFLEAYPLYMITEAPQNFEKGKMNYIDINVNYAFKYVRYVGPNAKYSVISGLEFYGYESTTELEENQEILYQPTNIPLVVINSENSAEPTEKENGVNCVVKIIDGNKIDTNVKASIKRRGNSSSNAAKKPYKLEFEEKKKILDFNSKAKKWNLLSLFNDKTILRTSVAFKVSEIFQFHYTPQCRHVDFIFNGEYRGTYYLCDKIEVKKGRLELTEMDENSNNEPEISGSYLFEATGFANQDEFYLVSKKGVPYDLRYPKRNKATDAQLNYLLNYIDSVEEEVYSGITKRIDKESFIKFMLLEEMAINCDSIWSIYMWKEREDDLLHFGPVWDFDLSYGSDSRGYPLNDKVNFIYKYSLTAGTMDLFVTNLLSNEEILKMFKDFWKKVSGAGLKDTIFKHIDKEVEHIKDSIKLNYIRWDMLKRKIMMNPVTKCTYEGEIQYLKDTISESMQHLEQLIDKANVDFIRAEVPGKKMGEGGSFGSKAQPGIQKGGQPNMFGGGGFGGGQWGGGQWGGGQQGGNQQGGQWGGNQQGGQWGGGQWGGGQWGGWGGGSPLGEIDQSCK